MNRSKKQKSVNEVNVASKVKMIEVIKIDVVKKLIYPVRISGYRSIKANLECEMITSAPINEFGDMFYVDDEGLFRDEPIGGFSIGGNLFAGHGLIVGLTSTGHDCSPWFTVDMAKRVISFVEPNRLPKPESIFFKASSNGSGGHTAIEKN